MARARSAGAAVRRGIPAYLAALAGVAAMTGVVGVVLSTVPISNASMLYLVVVLASATRLGRGPAIFASLAAFLLFDWFFIEPVRELTVADPTEWLSLLLFLITAIITSELAAGQRRRADEAERRGREAVLLFDVLRLSTVADSEAALGAVAERIRAELPVAAVAIELVVAGRQRSVCVGEAEACVLVRPFASAAGEILGGGREPTSDHPGSAGRWVRVVRPGRGAPPSARGTLAVAVRAGDRLVGRLALVRRPGGAPFGTQENRFLAVIATQLGLLVERAELQREANESEVLRQADALKTALLNAVSHDMRTPLASIVAAAGSLRQHDVSWTDEEREDFAAVVEQEAGRLDRIVGNLLDLSRMEAGVLRPETAWHDVAAVVDDVLGRLRSRTGGRRVTVDIAEELPPVRLDVVLVDQVLSNLVENAVRHTPAGSEIAVTARRVGEELQVEVADRGPGVAPDEMPRLFQPFYRARSGRSRAGGLGLGLAVAKGLVEAHGGRIWAEAREGGGARFVFTLPLGGGAGAPGTTA